MSDTEPTAMPVDIGQQLQDEGVGVDLGGITVLKGEEDLARLAELLGTSPGEDSDHEMSYEEVVEVIAEYIGMDADTADAAMQIVNQLGGLLREKAHQIRTEAEDGHLGCVIFQMWQVAVLSKGVVDQLTFLMPEDKQAELRQDLGRWTSMATMHATGNGVEALLAGDPLAAELNAKMGEALAEFLEGLKPPVEDVPNGGYL